LSGRYLNRESLAHHFARALTVCADINTSKVVHLFTASDFVAYCTYNLEAETEAMSTEEKSQHLASFPMPVSTAPLQGNGELFSQSICTTKPIFTTNYGFLGRGHEPVRAGDALCIFYGANTPHILRPNVDHHTLIGDCFVPGLMLGEAISWNTADGWFELR
jgi:hypothetical protein